MEAEGIDAAAVPRDFSSPLQTISPDELPTAFSAKQRHPRHIHHFLQRFPSSSRFRLFCHAGRTRGMRVVRRTW